MANSLAPLIQKLKDRWQPLSPRQRLALAGTAVLSVAAVALLITWASRPEYGTLFASLQSEDASQVIEYLKEHRIPYQLADNGATVRVPGKEIPELRITLAAQGLPKGGSVGFELFDEKALGETEFSQRIRYRRAVQGELARSIEQLDAVKSARVLLSLPEQRVFLEEQPLPSASVVVALRPGRRLERRQVDAIVHLVASAVEGLEPKNVTVVNAAGDPLTEEEGDGNAKHLEAQRAYEQQITRDVQSMLDHVLGATKSIVRVRAELDFSRQEVSRETYEPGGSNGQGLPLVQKQHEETANGGKLPPGGAPGAASNIGSGMTAAVVNASSNWTYRKNDTTNEYQYNKRTEHTMQVAPKVKHLSVSVLLDKVGRAASAPSGVSPDRIRQAVSAAAGIDLSRKDQLVVETVNFDTSAQDAEAQAMAATQRWQTIYSIGRGVALVALILLMLLLGNRALRPRYAYVPPTPPMLTEGEEEAAEPEGLGEGEAEPTFQPIPTSPEEARLQEMAHANPKQFAALLRAWMREEE